MSNGNVGNGRCIGSGYDRAKTFIRGWALSWNDGQRESGREKAKWDVEPDLELCRHCWTASKCWWVRWMSHNSVVWDKITHSLAYWCRARGSLGVLSIMVFILLFKLMTPHFTLCSLISKDSPTGSAQQPQYHVISCYSLFKLTGNLNLLTWMLSSVSDKFAFVFRKTSCTGHNIAAEYLDVSWCWCGGGTNRLVGVLEMAKFESW